MPRTRGRGGGKARGIGIERRGKGLSNKEGIGEVTNIEGRYLNTDYKTRPIDKTQDFITSLEDYSSSIGRFLLENSLDRVREIYINLIYLKYK
jgi:hypothetical protein